MQHWCGTPTLTRSLARVAGERIFVIGDAAGYVEPITGEGMAWALQAGAKVAELAVAGTSWTPALTLQWTRIHAELRVRQRTCSWLAGLLRQRGLRAGGIVGSGLFSKCSASGVAQTECTLSRLTPGVSNMPVSILGIGSAFPARKLAQTEAARIAAALSCENPQQRRLLETIFRKTEVHSRGCVLLDPKASDEQALAFYSAEANASQGPGTAARMERYARESLPLAVASSRAALSHARLEAGAITHLITVSCTGFFAPGIDVGLIASLELPATVARAHIGFMGCHGALNGLRVARAFAQSDPVRARAALRDRIVFGLHFQYAWNADNVVANALFADGSAARWRGSTVNSENASLFLAATGSCVLPGKPGCDVVDHRGSRFFDDTLRTRSGIDCAASSRILEAVARCAGFEHGRNRKLDRSSRRYADFIRRRKRTEFAGSCAGSFATGA